MFTYKICCPYCLTSHLKMPLFTDLERRCSNDGCRKQNGGLLPGTANSNGGCRDQNCDGKMPDTILNRVCLQLGKTPECPTSRGVYSRIECPICGHTLPYDFDQYDKYLHLALVGASSAGKTNYITTALEELRHANRKSFGFAISTGDDETRKYYEQCYKAIYLEKKPAPPSVPGEIHPLLFRMQNNSREMLNRVPAYSLSIFDGAGEDQKAWSDPRVQRYVADARMILLLLDPTAFAGIRNRLTPEELSQAGSGGELIDGYAFVEQMIGNLKSVCRRHLYGNRLGIPVAVTLAKADVLERFLGRTRVFTPSLHMQQGAFVNAEAQVIDQTIKTLMDDCDVDLTAFLDANLSNWKYFAVSSFGGSLSEQNGPVPMRVLDPILWDFSEEKIIKTVMG